MAQATLTITSRNYSSWSLRGWLLARFAELEFAELPMNLKAHFPGFKIWSLARADIDRIATIWSQCLSAHGGPFLFGERSIANAPATAKPSWRCRK